MDTQRLDKWLWAARFYKTRSLSSQAVEGGKVHLNGARTKPAKAIRVGDTLDIQRGPQQFSVEVVGLNEQRRPAKEAVLLYQETVESIKWRETAKQERIPQAQITPTSRPNKRERRSMQRLRRGGE